MATHTGRLILTIIALILVVAGAATGYWAQAIFWALMAMAIGYPFVRNGRINLNYDDDPVPVAIVASSAPIPVKGGTDAPPVYQKLFAGEVS